MAELGVSLATKLIEVISSEIIQEICDMWGYKSDLEDLHKTVTTIKNVLLDAESKRELTKAERGYIEDLKDVVYDADNLFDEFLTLAELKQIDGNANKGGKFSEKVRRFFSSKKKKMGQAYKMSCKVKEIKNQLDDIVDRHTKFGFKVDYKPICRRREESCSYLHANDIIGRDKDKETIIDMLLNPSMKEDFCFLTIVGMGGLGKTALAQLVFNDDKIKNEFPDLRLWVCVSDQDGEIFDVKAILCKIIELVDTDRKIDGSSTMELVQNRFQDQLRGKKFFLVLDDVWNEDRENWLALKKFLMLGRGGGSRIVITTRSETTSAIVGDEHAYKLQGLSQEDSWKLFKMSAFSNGCQQENYGELVEIGKKIVAKCHNVPLAIKVVGSLLFGQDIRKWESFEQSGLATNGEGNNRIMSILMLSYHNLESSLKSCFSYCAVFPKDHEIEKGVLIELWMAQGYIVPLEGGQSIDDAAEEHFVILLRRCFFQDVKTNECGDIDSIKIHDLMHDVAREVGKEEARVVTSKTDKMGDKIRHIRYIGDILCPNMISSCSNKIRSYINVSYKLPPVDTLRSLTDKWLCLRALDLSNSRIEILPDSIGKLLHLRFLDLSHSHRLEILPDAITRLLNLQTLNLHDCYSLRGLPKDFSKLVNLRHLDLLSDFNLIGMPSGLEKLSSLRVLTYFVVGNRNSSDVDELKALKPLINLKGSIRIAIGEYYTNRNVEGMNNGVEGGYLKSMKYLTSVYIIFIVKLGECVKRECVKREAVLEVLEPPSNLKGFYMCDYHGTTIRKWGRAESNWAVSLSRLVNIEFERCRILMEMPVLSKLPHLKSLLLKDLDSLEYMENTSIRNDNEATNAELATFFPSLKKLSFYNLDKLKGWWKEEPSADDNHGLNSRWRSPSLSELHISDCPNLTLIPHCPNLEKLTLTSSKNFQILKTADDDTSVSVKFWYLHTDNASILKSVPTNSLTFLWITEGGDQERENKSEVGEAFQRSASSLQSLSINEINRLKRLAGGTGLQHFSALEEIKLGRSNYFYDSEVYEEDDNMMLWKSFPQSLRSLYLYRFDWTSLPKGMQYLTSLKALTIYNCTKLTALPEWISSLFSLQSLVISDCYALISIPEAMRTLTSLQRLTIEYSPNLAKRCKEPDGEDRPKIQHIPQIELRYRWYQASESC